MSSRATRLQPAVDQAGKRRDEAVLKLAEQQQRFAKAEQQLVELQRYRLDYASTSASGGISVGVLLNQQNFVERIDQAIVQQTLDIERQRRQLDVARGGWRDAHARERALGSVIDRYRELERKAEDRHEQNQLDERSQLRRSSPGRGA